MLETKFHSDQTLCCPEIESTNASVEREARKRRGGDCREDTLQSASGQSDVLLVTNRTSKLVPRLKPTSFVTKRDWKRGPTSGYEVRTEGEADNRSHHHRL